MYTFINNFAAAALPALSFYLEFAFDTPSASRVCTVQTKGKRWLQRTGRACMEEDTT